MGKKRTDCGKRKGRTEKSLPLHRACLSSPFQDGEERELEEKEGEKTKKENMEEKRA